MSSHDRPTSLEDTFVTEEHSRPLLFSHDDEDRVWDRVEEAPDELPAERTMADIMRESPGDVLHLLETSGVKKLAEFSVPDQLIFGCLGDNSIVTMGSSTAEIEDYRRVWMRELQSLTQGGPPSADTSIAGWKTEVNVVAYVVTVQNAAGPASGGLLHPLVRRWQAGGCTDSVFAFPAVQAVIDWKWDRFARELLLLEFAFFAAWLISFYSFTASFQDEDVNLDLRELLSTGRGCFTVAMDLTALLSMTPFIIIEGATLSAYGFWGWNTAWNLLDVSTYALQLSIVCMHIFRFAVGSAWLSIAASTQCILLLFKLQFFSRVFTPTRFAFFDNIAAVLHDLRWFLTFLMLIVLGYSAAFTVLFRKDQEAHPEFSTLPLAFVNMVNWASGNADLSGLYDNASHPVVACVMGITFVFSLGIVLLNLLVSLMTTSLDRIISHEGIRMLSSQALVIDELETTMPEWVIRRFPHLFPPFLHVLRVDPQRTDVVATKSERNQKTWDLGQASGAMREAEEETEDKTVPSPESAQQQLVQRIEGMERMLQEVLHLLSGAGQGST